MRWACSPPRCCQSWNAIFSAISVAVDPLSEKKKRVRPAGAMPDQALGQAIAPGWVRPSMVEWATRSSCSRTAASMLGWRWPWTLHHSDETPSR